MVNKSVDVVFGQFKFIENMLQFRMQRVHGIFKICFCEIHHKLIIVIKVDLIKVFEIEMLGKSIIVCFFQSGHVPD